MSLNEKKNKNFQQNKSGLCNTRKAMGNNLLFCSAKQINLGTPHTVSQTEPAGG